MTQDDNALKPAQRWFWHLVLLLLALYVAARLGAFSLSVVVPTPDGAVLLPNTFAGVDHPFHVARADVLWRELASGQFLRWIGQHQGGYPVEFYPLGEAWLEVAIRALSLGNLAAEGAHTLAVIALFLLPGLGFLALGREDEFPPAVGLLALVLHLSLPGGWYDGGYTELVQWGLVTNVAGAVAAFLMLPLLLHFLRRGTGLSGAAAAVLAAAAIYCNPRSIVALAALGAGAWIGTVVRAGAIRPGVRTAAPSITGTRHAVPSPPETSPTRSDLGFPGGSGDLGAERAPLASPLQEPGAAIAVLRRLLIAAGLAALLAAPELLALARFGGLYAFVRYSGYGQVGDYLARSLNAVTPVIVVLAAAGLYVAVGVRTRLALLEVASSLAIYVLLTLAVAFVPFIAGMAPQLEPTRLMPVQRLLMIYLAASAVWLGLSWILRRIVRGRQWVADAATLAIACVVLAVQTRPLSGAPPDPASPTIPPVSLYQVATSARPEQADLQAAVRAADAAAATGTALLVLGSALSWHQPLWGPLWTSRPLYYDNWLWFWHPDHSGTPGYAFPAGNHYPDPERTLDPDYLARHGIGAVVVTGAARDAAARSPLLQPLRQGVYDAYRVENPVTTITIGDRNVSAPEFANGALAGKADSPAPTVIVRTNWHPRWEAVADSKPAVVARRSDGYIAVRAPDPMADVVLRYNEQPLDWAARLLAAAGLVGLIALAWPTRYAASGRTRWYAGLQHRRRPGGARAPDSGDSSST